MTATDQPVLTWSAVQRGTRNHARITTSGIPDPAAACGHGSDWPVVWQPAGDLPRCGNCLAALARAGVAW